MQAAKDVADSLRQSAQEEAATIGERATQEAQNGLREVTVETDRLRNATQRRCQEMVSEAEERAERLKAHERKMREKVVELEKTFGAFRDEVEALIPDTIDLQAAESRSTNEPRESTKRAEEAGVGVQPKPTAEPKASPSSN